MSTDPLECTNEATNLEADNSDYTVEVVQFEDLKKLCRACLSVHITANMFKSLYGDVPLSRLYRDLLSKDVDPNNDLPQFLCEKCIGQLIRINKFKDKCLEIEAVLKTVITQHNEEIQEEVKIKLPEPPDVDVDEKKCCESSVFKQKPFEHTYASFEQSSSLLNLKHQKPTFIKLRRMIDLMPAVAGNPSPRKCKRKSLKCWKCGEQFKNSLDYRNHLLMEKSKSFNCGICSKVFNSQKRLEDHFRGHSGERPFLCPICGKQFATEISLNCHVKTHNKTSTKKQYECNICGEHFDRKPALEFHKMLHGDLEKSYNCLHCDQKFFSQRNLNIHLKFHPSDEIEQIEQQSELDTNGKSYICELCGRAFTNSKNLYSHKILHGEKKHVCTVCGKAFHQRGHLNTHYGTHTKSIRPKQFKCRFCVKWFADPHSLRSHLNVHTGDTPYKCRICSKQFKTSGGLSSHVKIHSSEKLHCCPICKKGFHFSHILKIHIRRHTGEKPFDCDLCPKKFVSLKSLRRHKMTHIKTDSLDGSFICDICSKGFSTDHNLEMHRQKHMQGNKPWIRLQGQPSIVESIIV